MNRAGFIGSAVAATISTRATAGAATMRAIVSRPYDWSTPADELGRALFTPNNVFFIRSHMGPPPSINVHSWRLTIDGLVDRRLSLTLDDLKRFPKHEVPAVLQCSGDGRYFYGESYPNVSHPAGAQWSIGGVGNARWAGARVRDVLTKAGIKRNARYSTNFGLDNPLLAKTPKFTRGIELDKLMDENTLLAYEMNGTTLPYYHGYPVRLLVPGWEADHSVKWLMNMTLTSVITNNFWTAVAYRYPNKPGPPGVLIKATEMHPVTAMNVKSLILSLEEGSKVHLASRVVVSGFAWSGGGAYATRVDISIDGARTWHPARLGDLIGNFSWRPYTFAFTPTATGQVVVMARAQDSLGAVQPDVPPWNPGGYIWNGIHKVTLEVVRG
jgi:sulfite oxidase